ncbi:hypothetical protein [Hymenobacter arizonensis]|uniref:Uncharacterized protein n=1 Tax=Hymenobacter arizonensis TaxID=1227077 RepID=A0A1I5XYQ0_HYMAR|nr:hypothetical protein [Hymenobacter arizonensis]SFQ36857.1 hypothetical protein SAMN04515668_2112 [Hymenobacter arizonensis]
MVEVTVHHDTVVFTVRGLHKVFAFKSELTVPRSHITEVRADPEAAKHIEGLRAGGTSVPGLVTAGTFYLDHQGSHKPSFIDVAKPENVVVITLRDEEYQQLIIEVDDPVEVVAQLATSG